VWNTKKSKKRCAVSIKIPDIDVMEIDCSANPLDLRPAVKGIVARVDQVSRYLRTSGSNQKIVLVMGESHFSAAHKLLQIGVIRALKDQQDLEALADRMVIAHEIDHTDGVKSIKESLAAYASGEFQIDPQGLFERLSPQEQWAFIIAHIHYIDTPLSSKALQIISHDLRIPTINNDMSHTGDLLNFQSEKMQPYGDGTTPIHTTSPEGMAARNRFMADELIKFMQDQNAGLSIQTTGLHHVFGCLAAGHDYQSSLAAILKDKAAVVIPVIDDGPYLDDYEARRDHPNTICITGLSRMQFRRNAEGLCDNNEAEFMRLVSTYSRIPFEIPDRQSDRYFNDIARRQVEAAERRCAPQSPDDLALFRRFLDRHMK
jgi:hypothetical protein